MESTRIGFNLPADPFEGKSQKRTLKLDGEGHTFADMIRNAVNDVDTQHKTAESNVNDIVTGKSENVHEAMISMQKASLSFQLMLEIRNKALETYQELSRMQM